MKSKRTRRQRIGRWCLVLAGIIILVEISARIVGNGGASKQAAPPVMTSTPTPTRSPAARSSPTPSPEGDDSTPATHQSKSSRPDAVSAAADALEQVSVAQFLPPLPLKIALEDTVVPWLRDRYQQKYPQAGENLALKWNWGTPDLALANAQYKVTSQQCRIDRFGGGKATIMVQTKTHWVSRAINAQNLVVTTGTDTPLIMVVKMRWVNGKWLFVSSKEAKQGPLPEGEQPVQKTNLDYPVAFERFRPYLKKGYASCAS